MAKNSRDLKNITLEDKVYDTILKNRLIENNDKIIVGVSGGPDSICLLNVLYNLKNRFKDEKDITYNLCVAHVNHMIRKESFDEKIYVENFCKKLDIEFYYLEADVEKLALEQKISTEMAGRNVRYNFFNKILLEKNCNKIAIAHNADDTVETILLNMSRGTGLKGLIGINYKNDNIIRPLLDIFKNEILSYCDEKKLEPKIDQTNFCDIYTRNKVRLNVIPVLKENLGENFLNKVLDTRQVLIKEEEFLEEYTNKIIKDSIITNNNFEILFDFKNIILENEAISYRCIREIIKILISNLDGISKVHVSDIYNILMKNQKGKVYMLGNKFKLQIVKKNFAKIERLGGKYE